MRVYAITVVELLRKLGCIDWRRGLAVTEHGDDNDATGGQDMIIFGESEGSIDSAAVTCRYADCFRDVGIVRTVRNANS